MAEKPSVEKMMAGLRTRTGHCVQGGKVVLVFYDDMEILTQAFDSKKIGEAVRRVVKTSFQSGNIGGAKCGQRGPGPGVCGREGAALPGPGEQGGWDSKDIRGVKIDTLVVKGAVVGVDTETGVTSLNTVTGMVEEVESEVGGERLAG